LDADSLALFGFLKVKNPKDLDRLPEQDVMKRWWKYMADIMETNPDHSPLSIPLKEIFYLP
jgi:L-rhamnose mutarotase